MNLLWSHNHHSLSHPNASLAKCIGHTRVESWPLEGEPQHSWAMNKNLTQGVAQNQNQWEQMIALLAWFCGPNICESTRTFINDNILCGAWHCCKRMKNHFLQKIIQGLSMQDPLTRLATWILFPKIGIPLLCGNTTEMLLTHDMPNSFGNPVQLTHCFDANDSFTRCFVTVCLHFVHWTIEWHFKKQATVETPERDIVVHFINDFWEISECIKMHPCPAPKMSNMWLNLNNCERTRSSDL